MRYFLVLLLLAPFFASAQPGSVNVGAIRSRVTDSTTVIQPSGYGIIYFNAQSGKFRKCVGGVCSDLTGGGGYTFSNGLTESGGGVKLGGPILESTVLTTGVDEKTEVTFDSTSVSVKAEYPTHEALNTFTYSKTSFDYSSGGTNYINEYTGWDTKKGYSLSVGNATNTMLWELDLFSGLNFDNTFGTGQFNMDANFGQFKTYQQNTTSSTTIDQDFTRVQISSDSAIFFVDDDGVYIGDNVESYKMPLNVGSNGQVLTTDGAGAATWQAAPVVKNPSTGTVDNAVGFVSGGFGSNGTSYTVQTFGTPWGASSSGFQSISNFSAYANNTVIIAEYVILAMKSDGTAAASGTFTARFRKNNSGTWTADSGGTLTTSDATVITTAVGDINGGVPGYTWTSGAYSGTYNVGVTVKLSSHTY